MGRDGTLKRQVDALADGTRTIREIAEHLNVGTEYVSATLGRLGKRDMVAPSKIRPKGSGWQGQARRRLALLHRTHEALAHPDATTLAQLRADIQREIER